MKVLTPKCTCGCPKTVHSHVGCLTSGCDCQHGIPTSMQQAKQVGLSDEELDTCPRAYIESWKKDNPRKSIIAFVTKKI